MHAVDVELGLKQPLMVARARGLDLRNENRLGPTEVDVLVRAIFSLESFGNSTVALEPAQRRHLCCMENRKLLFF